MKWVLASSNKGKLAEFKQILGGDVDVIPQAELGCDDAEETGLTFVENALLKARHACQQTGLPALADDSGLAVDILNGAPGLYSARYAGEHGNAEKNIAKLLHELKDVPEAERSASFHCVIVLLDKPEQPDPIICHGRWQGRVLLEPTGSGGFGYDPVFYVPEQHCSAAELPRDIKNAISHRGLALAQLRQRLGLNELSQA